MIDRKALENYVPRRAAELAFKLNVDPVAFEIVLEEFVRDYLTEQAEPPRIHIKGAADDETV